MDRDEILQRVTDALCGELDREALAELESALAADPDLAAEARALELTWQRLGRLPEEKPSCQAILTQVLDRILNRDLTELTDEDLDMAAGGIPMPDGPEGGGEKR